MGLGRFHIPQEQNAGKEGQALAEYTLILVFIALACIAAATLLGTTVQGLYSGFRF